MKKKLYTLVFVLVMGFTFQAEPVEAQCPMCRMSAESNLESGGSEGKGLNNGILYLLSMPYLVVGGIAFFWYRNRKTGEIIEEGAPY